MKLTIENGWGRVVTIEHPARDVSINGLLAGLIDPALRGLGYTSGTIDDVLNYDEMQGYDELVPAEVL